ncbi:MAG: carbonic anhydrase family protein [Proteobacteria bacterium]|nr:carbonic anhydrase family protein [Pseudomonadota bacterium]MBU1140147.1 carbonic anhydrase family protein [Pseudomonadota bacterium]MBU1231659.1 carbonic anhydrase family protein [Pseudomonadota bacterium]MBU1417669.1 carbonic anhydrase family protein [Pseudomonadota bacterium]MBU1456146.1 carbonic anhydrase family protein [Pseudomonadota bacterium]
MKATVIAALGAGLLMAATAGASGQDTHWGYSGHEGPEFWGDLSHDYAICKTGKNQSPIDVDSLVEAELSPIVFQYNAVPLDIVNNGHTVQVNYAPGSTITVNGHTYNLLQFHFHTPSENTVKGQFFAMEAHLVHSDDAGNLSVVGVMFEEGAENPFLAGIWSHMPEKAGVSKSLPEVTLNVKDMLPSNKSYYRFNGSLTTPPCSEGVNWMLLQNPVPVSRAQADKFHTLMGGDNNRPVQPVNARPILQ